LRWIILPSVPSGSPTNHALGAMPRNRFPRTSGNTARFAFLWPACWLLVPGVYSFSYRDCSASVASLYSFDGLARFIAWWCGRGPHYIAPAACRPLAGPWPTRFATCARFGFTENRPIGAALSPRARSRICCGCLLLVAQRLAIRKVGAVGAFDRADLSHDLESSRGKTLSGPSFASWPGTPRP